MDIDQVNVEILDILHDMNTLDGRLRGVLEYINNQRDNLDGYVANNDETYVEEMFYIKNENMYDL